MFNIQKKLKSESSNCTSSNTNNNNNTKKALDLRQRLLQKEFESLKQLPVGCSIFFENSDKLYEFKLNVIPDKDSLWFNGKFEFFINVPEG
jgi:ubiquitin-protein ligase